jgi:UDP-N-acetylmuramoyl-tripeptide--D-alanyl-D-alanine ligase
MEISELYDIYNEYPVVTTDSRNCPKDSIFFALKGENFNGNRFAGEALEAGCAYAVVDEWEGDPNNERVIVVDDVLECVIVIGRSVNIEKQEIIVKRRIFVDFDFGIS